MKELRAKHTLALKKLGANADACERIINGACRLVPAFTTRAATDSLQPGCQAHRDLAETLWEDNHKTILPFVWFSKHFPPRKHVVPFMHTYDEGIVKCVMQYVLDYAPTLGLSSYVLKESARALGQIKMLRSAFLPVQTRAGGASLKCTGMVAEEYKAAARWLLKWLVAILDGKEEKKSARKTPKKADDIDEWTGPEARIFLQERGLGTKRKDYMPMAPDDPYGYGVTSPAQLNYPIKADHARVVAKANWQKEPVSWKTDVASLRRMLVAAHNLVNYASLKHWNEDVAAGFEDRRKKFMVAAEEADKKFRQGDCEPHKTFLLRKSVLAGLYAHADQSWAFGPIRLLDEALGEKFVQYLKRRYRRSHGKGGAHRQAERAERLRNLDKFRITEPTMTGELAGVPEEVCACVSSLVDTVCATAMDDDVCDMVADWCNGSEDEAALIYAALAEDDAEIEMMGTTQLSAIAEELADRHGSRRVDVTVHKSTAALTTALADGDVLLMWKSSSGVGGDNMLYAEVTSHELNTHGRNLQKVQMKLAGTDTIGPFHWMHLDCVDEAKEESILHLRLEPVLLLRKPQRQSGRENKWWVVGKDYTEFDGTKWFHA
jgi:hypothetical protein